MTWKVNYGFAVYFAALMVWGVASRDWLGLGISALGFGLSVGVAERGRRRAKSLPPHTCTQPNKETDGQEHREGDQGEAADPVAKPFRNGPL